VTGLRAYRVPRSRVVRRFQRLTRSLTDHRPPVPCETGFILPRATRLFRATDAVPPARRHARSFPGVSAPFATTAGRVTVMKQGSPALPRRRPQGFSPSRRFTPPPALWAYFIPQPRPGFALQGFCLCRSRTASSASRALLVLRARALPSVARERQTRFRATFRAFPRHNPSRSANG